MITNSKLVWHGCEFHTTDEEMLAALDGYGNHFDPMRGNSYQFGCEFRKFKKALEQMATFQKSGGKWMSRLCQIHTATSVKMSCAEVDGEMKYIIVAMNGGCANAIELVAGTNMFNSVGCSSLLKDMFTFSV